MQSMTGYGHASHLADDMEVSVEIRTVNGRFLDIVTRLPKEALRLESPIKKAIQSELRRGRVEVFLNLASLNGDQFQLDTSLVDNYLRMARTAGVQGVAGSLDLNALFQLPGVLSPRERNLSDERSEGTILEVVRQALKMVAEERRREGARLEKDLLCRLDHVEAIMKDIDLRRPDLVDHYREKLSKRVEKMSGGHSVDPARLAQEVIFYAERADFSEELTRLAAHLAGFRQQIVEAGEGSIGKRLDFLCQELNRESNTILSKAHSAEIADLALECKTEVEKIREQVQNVE